MPLLESYECPRCGAPLPKGGGETIVCKYCRATIRLDQRVVHRGAAQAILGMPRWIKAEMLLALVFGLGIAVWQLRTHWRHTDPTPPEPTTFDVSPTAVSNAAPARLTEATRGLGRVEGKLVLAQAEGSERQMIVVVAENANDVNRREVVALSSVDGHTLWKWELPAGETASTTERAWVRDSLLVRTLQEIVRLDGTSGQLVWRAPVTQSDGRLCVTEAYVGLRNATAPRRVADWSTGRPFDVKSGACESPYSSHDAAPNFRYLTDAALQSLARGLKNFRPVRGLVPRQGNARVVLGISHENQEAAPSVAVVADGVSVWRQEVSAYTLASFPEPPLAAVRKESIVIPYWDTQNRALRLSAFNLDKGQRLWDASLVDNMEVATKADLDVGATLDGTVLVRLFDGRLNAYSLQSGKLLWSVGGR